MIPTPYPPRLHFPKSRKSVQRNVRFFRGGPPGGQWVRHPIFFGGLVFIHLLRNTGAMAQLSQFRSNGPLRYYPISMMESMTNLAPFFRHHGPSSPLLAISPSRFARDFHCVPCHLPDSPAPLYCHSSLPCRPLAPRGVPCMAVRSRRSLGVLWPFIIRVAG